NYRNRDGPANGAPWAGWQVIATAHRAPTRRRLLSRRRVGARPAGARAAVIASADGLQLRASGHHRHFQMIARPAEVPSRSTHLLTVNEIRHDKAPAGGAASSRGGGQQRVYARLQRANSAFTRVFNAPTARLRASFDAPKARLRASSTRQQRVYAR